MRDRRPLIGCGGCGEEKPRHIHLGGGRFEGLGGGEHRSDFGHQILKRQDINRR